MQFELVSARKTQKIQAQKIYINRQTQNEYAAVRDKYVLRRGTNTSSAQPDRQSATPSVNVSVRCSIIVSPKKIRDGRQKTNCTRCWKAWTWAEPGKLMLQPHGGPQSPISNLDSIPSQSGERKQMCVAWANIENQVKVFNCQLIAAKWNQNCYAMEVLS